jgi:hypothetical protein
MPAVDLLQPYLDEELVETVGPCGREQRVVVGPQHRGRRGNPFRRLRHPLGHHPVEPAGADAVVPDGRAERARHGVHRDEVVDVVVGDGEVRTGPVRQEMAQVATHRFGLPVDEFVRDRELVEGQVPELLLRCRGQDPLADARQRRRLRFPIKCAC